MKARGGVPVNVNNFRADVNASGTIDAADLLMAKARAGWHLRSIGRKSQTGAAFGGKSFQEARRCVSLSAA